MHEEFPKFVYVVFVSVLLALLTVVIPSVITVYFPVSGASVLATLMAAVVVLSMKIEKW